MLSSVLTGSTALVACVAFLEAMGVVGASMNVSEKLEPCTAHEYPLNKEIRADVTHW